MSAASRAPDLVLTPVDDTWTGAGGDPIRSLGFRLVDEDGRLRSFDDLAADGVVVFKVAGVSYRREALQDLAFTPGRPVMLVRDVGNQHDRFAVEVRSADRSALAGFVPRDWSPTVADMLAGGPVAALALLEWRDAAGARVALRVAVGREPPRWRPAGRGPAPSPTAGR